MQKEYLSLSPPAPCYPLPTPVSMLPEMPHLKAGRTQIFRAQPRSPGLHIAVGTWLCKAQAHRLLKPPLSHPGQFLSSKSNTSRAFLKPNMFLHKPYTETLYAGQASTMHGSSSLYTAPQQDTSARFLLGRPLREDRPASYRAPWVLHRPASHGRLKMHHQSFLTSLAP